MNLFEKQTQAYNGARNAPVEKSITLHTVAAFSVDMVFVQTTSHENSNTCCNLKIGNIKLMIMG